MKNRNFKYKLVLIDVMVRGDSLRQGTSSSHDSGYTHFFEMPFFQYMLVLIIIGTLAISIISLVNIYQLKAAIVPKTISANDFLKKLTAHNEMKSYVGVSPLNLIQINNNNFGNLQSQIGGLDISYVGSFIVQYTDRIIIYDYDNDKIRGSVNLQQPQPQLPADFFTKLNTHPELQGLQNQQPIGGQLDANSLSTLKQQFPDVYTNSKVGDFLLRYQTKLIIYDYPQDKIINVVKLG